MTEPVETTLEEARRCPKCKQPGVFSRKTRVKPAFGVTRGAEMHHYVCQNERCRWFNEVCRSIQVNPDGSIPPPLVKRDRQFPKIPDYTDAFNEALERQLAAELGGGAEVTR